MKFSALGSVYAKENPIFLNKALESLFKQTLPANEVVLVHDGILTEGLYDSLGKWKDKLPLKEVVIDHSGLAAALNAGLKACSYDLVARFDSDDINRTNRFQVQVGHLEANPDVCVLSSNVGEFYQEPGDGGGVRKVPKNHSSILRYAKVRSPINHPAVVFRKSSMEAVKEYPLNFFHIEDYALWLKLLAEKNKFENIDRVLVDVRVGNNMIARRRGFSYLKAEFKIYRLKRKLGFNSKTEGMFVFLARCLPRLLPRQFLRIIYGVLLRER